MICLSFRINLLLFSEERTEKATPKKRRDARQKGQVAKSRELISSILLLLVFFTIKILAPYIYNELSLTITKFLSFSDEFNSTYTTEGLSELLIYCITVFAKTCGPIILIAAFASIISNYLQVGFIITSKPLIPDFKKMNPIEGFKRLFSIKSVVELFKSIFKITIIGYLIFDYFKKNFYILPELILMNVEQTLSFIGNTVLNVGFRACFAMFILSLFDYGYQLWDYEKNLKMSKQEIKEEYKQTEGDPKIKSKIKEKQRHLALRRMMAEVPKADVIITNPTHFAVAIKYDTNISDAPILIAKGKDLIAQKIKQTANEIKIPIVENKPLAQALYKSVEIGHVIPPDLYKAVAEVLAFVYSMKNS